jgi:large conductance mechanosensitive channel
MDPIHRIAELEQTKRAFSLLEEFKNFAFKGNAIDLAVGVIIGAAFAKIVDSLVKQVMTPLIAAILPVDQSYKDWEWVIKGQEIKYGLFLSEVITFFLTALILFLFIYKFLGWIMKQKRQEAVAPPPLTKDQELLTEIRDLLKRDAAPAAPEAH